ncbi:MAG: hypothetical protein NZZ41_06985, partial [Candidatus Dojkabacteria bacterium]|nr:hypothetical protein [Candidatus Dojkabacteria bacterium]
RNKKLNSVKLRFEASDYDIDLYMRSNVKNVYNDDDNLYNIDVKIPTLRLIGQIMNDRYEKMIRTELNITSRGGLDVFPGLVIGSYKKEDIENMINFAESILDEQEKAERNEEENSRTFIQFHMYLKRDINTMKEMLKEEKDEYHLLTYLPMAYLPKTNNKEYDEIRRDLLWRVYNCRNLHNNEILIESKDLFFLSNLAMLDNAIDSVLQIKANYLTGSKLLIVDMYKYKMFYVPATKVNEEDNNLFIVYGMRAYPILEGFDEERISYLLQKVSEVVEFTEKYVKSKEYEDYLASIFPILEKMHERLKGQSWFDRVYERAKSLHESYVENHNKVVLLRHLNAMLHSKQEV